MLGLLNYCTEYNGEVSGGVSANLRMSLFSDKDLPERAETFQWTCHLDGPDPCYPCHTCKDFSAVCIRSHLHSYILEEETFSVPQKAGCEG